MKARLRYLEFKLHNLDYTEVVNADTRRRKAAKMRRMSQNAKVFQFPEPCFGDNKNKA